MRAGPAKRPATQAGRKNDWEDQFLVGKVAENLSPLELFDSLESSLEILRDATRADDCELFLLEHHHGDLLLSVAQGLDRDALMTRLRFKRGAGYPGIVVKDNQPLVTNELHRDSRYLREAVKRRGIHSYACVPLTDFGNGVLGSLNLAWRKDNVQLEQVSNLMRRVANPLSNAIYASLAGCQSSVRTALDRIPEENRPEEWLGNLLQLLQHQTGAGGGMVFLVDPNRKNIVQTVSSGGVQNAQKGTLGVPYQKCIDLCERHGVLLSEGGDYHLDLCKKVVDSGHVACCVPLVLNGRLVGRILLDYGENPRRFLNKDLIKLTAMTDEAAIHIPARFFDPPLEGKIRPAGIHAEPVEGLVVQCLGGFSVIKDGRPLPHASFSYRSKARTLLKILLLRAGKKVNRNALIEMLWPETDSVAGANRLYGVVHALRAAIEPGFQKRNWIYILRDGDGYFFNKDSPHRVDIFEFHQFLKNASKTNRANSEDQVLDNLLEAVAIYQGDLFDHEIDAEFFEAEREHLRQVNLEAAERLVEIRIRRGDLNLAANCLRHLLRIYPAEENLHQELIKVLLLQGKRKEARKQFHSCVDFLRDELDIDPLPETMQMESLLVHLS